MDPVTGEDIITIHERNVVKVRTQVLKTANINAFLALLTVTKLEFALYLVMCLNYGIIKLSVLLLYRRLFVGEIFNRYTLAMCAIIALWSLSFFFGFAFECHTNITNYWTSPATIEAHCDNTSALVLGFAVSDVLTDLMILAIPIPIVWRLHMSTRSKIGVTGIFLLGLL